MINLSVTANIGGALKTLEQTSRKAAKGLATSTVHAAAIIRKNMVDSMPQGRFGKADEAAKGRFRRNEGRSKPGQPPFKQTGRLARSIRFGATPEGGARIYSSCQGRGVRKNNDFLARIMESGTATMAPRPFTRPAVNKSLSRLPVLLRVNTEQAFR